MEHMLHIQSINQFRRFIIRYDNNITAQEISDYVADMWELAGEFLAPPTEEEMEAMAEWYKA